MNALLWLALGLFIGGLGFCALKLRDGDLRIGWFAITFASFGICVGSWLWIGAPGAVSFNPSTLGAFSLVAAAACSVGSLFALTRSLKERDSAEELHWDSMETVRKLGDLAARPREKRTDALRALLEIGCERFDFEIGLIGRVRDDELEIEQLCAPDDLGVSPAGLRRQLARAVRQTCMADRPLALVGEALTGETNAADERCLQAYLGTSLRAESGATRCLAFASERAPRRRLTATDKDLVGLLGLWLARDLVRGGSPFDARPAAAPLAALSAPAAKPTAPREKTPKAAPVELRVDANAALRRLIPVLTRQRGSAVELALEPELALVRIPRLSLRAIAESLIRGANSISSRGGLKLTTGNVDLNSEKPPETASSAQAFVTLSVRIAADDIDAEAVTRLFEPTRHVAGKARTDELLPLLRLQRLLQRDGGDLSVELEPGRCATLTAFLRAAPAADPCPPASSSPASSLPASN